MPDRMPECMPVGSLKRRVRSQLARLEMKNARCCGAKHISKSNVQNTPASDHFWKLRCRKSARRCGAKHISKSKCTKHTSCGPLLDVQMSFCVAGARDSARCQEWAKRDGFVAFSTTTTTTPHYTPLHYTQLHYTTLQLHSTTLHYNYTTLQLHYTPLHYATTTLHYIPLHYTTLKYITLHYTTLHYSTFHYTTLH